MDNEVRLIRGSDRIRQLSGRHDIAGEVARVRAEMAEADRAYAMGVAMLRTAAELTQAEIAGRMGVTPAAVSRPELPPGLLLSTLSSYLQAIGAARMTVSFAGGHDVTVSLAELAQPASGAAMPESPPPRS